MYICYKIRKINKKSGIMPPNVLTFLCPKIEKARIGKTAGIETMGDKLGKMYDSSLS